EGKLNDLVAALGPELEILTRAPLDEIGRVGGELLAEGIGRLRRGDVRRVPGYDGEYGVITLFDPAELGGKGTGAQAETLFDVPVPAQRPAAEPAAKAKRPAAAKAEPKRKPAPPAPPPPIPPQPSPHEPFEPMLAGMEEVGTGLLDRLDAMQRVAASAPGGPLL
ncbi:AAA family ATPase, partial [Micromonospora sp. DH15]|nr:AAA family ATPase [Micromonospora sp. DH15]